MRLDLTVRLPDGSQRDLRIDAPAHWPADDVLTKVLHTCGFRGDEPVALTNGGRVDRQQILSRCGLRSGCTLTTSLIAPAHQVAQNPGPQLRVVSGPDSGLARTLRSAVLVGRDQDAGLQLSDPEVSRRHAVVETTRAGIQIRDLGSTNGTRLATDVLGAEPTALSEHDLVRIGDSVLEVVTRPVPPASVRVTDDGTWLVNPAPREFGAPLPPPIELPQAPQTQGRRDGRWLAAGAPLVLGIAMAVVMRSTMFLAFSLLSPATLLMTAAIERSRTRRDGRLTRAAHRAAATHAAEQVRAALKQELTQRRRGLPDPGVIGETATTPGHRLWERRGSDDDLLTLRIGCATQHAHTQVRCAGVVSSAGTIDAAPFAVTLRDGPLGLAGATPLMHGIARSLIAQLAVLTSPNDVQIIALLADPPAWNWLRWLPHLRGPLATDSASRAAGVAELESIVERRRDHAVSWRGPWTVVLVDRPVELELPALAQLLADGAALGISAICIDRGVAQLPAGCATVVTPDEASGSRIAVRTPSGSTPGVLADQVNLEWAGRIARALAPFDAGTRAANRLPDSCGLIELHAASLEIEDVLLRWKRSAPVPSALLGIGAEGAVEVDLVRDGPHALIAGTTGAGKSELLRSWIASLALEHPPEDVAFVLVDYKGGAAFAECALLPHTTGLVTDLDPHLVRRVLTSLGAELRRREALFAQRGVTEWCAYRNLHSDEPLPRLVVVVDEFAALAAELPEFVTGLVSLAQRGRSLGIHLILATQRPAGVVSAEIRANTALRIALRTTSAQDSLDVLDSAMASQLDSTIPGRGYLLAGQQITGFQAAWAGGRGIGRVDVAKIEWLDEWRRPIRDIDAVVDEGPTQLARIVTALCEATEQSGRAAIRRPWLPPLPIAIPRHALTTGSGYAIGVADLPQQQLQQPVVLDPNGGAVLLVGGARSGRTTALTTLAAAAAHQFSPDELHLHVIDCGGSLGDLVRLPHIGTSVTDRDVELIERLLVLLEDELRRRAECLGSLGFGSVAEARAAGQSTPLLMLLLDGWERFTSTDEQTQGRCTERLLALARSATAGGLTVAVTGDRQALTPRVLSAFTTKYVLPLAERGDYALLGIGARDVPEERQAGRALTTEGGELQLAHLGTQPTREESRTELDAIAQHGRQRPPPRDRIQLRQLPNLVVLSDLSARANYVLGVGGDSADPIEVDLFAGQGRLLVAGPARSGRSSVLRSIAVQAPPSTRVLIVASPRSPLSADAREHGWQLIGDNLAALDEAALDNDNRTLLLVDDCEQLLGMPLGDRLTELVRRAAPALAAVVAGRSDELAVTYRGVGAEVRRARSGLLLQPGSLDGELVGVSLPRRRPQPIPGRGLLIADPSWRDPDPIPLQTLAV